jgi:hypothetical protein
MMFKSVSRIFLIIVLVALFPGAAAAQNLAEILADGPISQVRYDSRGKFKQAVGITFIKAEPDKVWEVMTNFDRYVEFMPQLVDLKVEKKEGNSVEVFQEVEIPGPNAKYTLRMDLDKATYSMRATYIRGSLKGGSWSYQIKAFNGGSLLYYYCYSMLPGYVTAIEDESQTMTIGVNVATSVAVVNAFKECVEKGYSGKKKSVKKD